MKKGRVLVTGAGGFIGHHLVKRLKKEGYWVRGADLKRPEYEPTDADDFQVTDLRSFENCQRAVAEVDQVYTLAADMGGIGYITANHADISRNNVLINAHMLEASREAGVKRLLYSSSACVYPQYKQKDADVTPLTEGAGPTRTSSISRRRPRDCICRPTRPHGIHPFRASRQSDLPPVPDSPPCRAPMEAGGRQARVRPLGVLP